MHHVLRLTNRWATRSNSEDAHSTPGRTFGRTPGRTFGRTSTNATRRSIAASAAAMLVCTSAGVTMCTSGNVRHCSGFEWAGLHSSYYDYSPTGTITSWTPLGVIPVFPTMYLNGNPYQIQYVYSDAADGCTNGFDGQFITFAPLSPTTTASPQLSLRQAPAHSCR